MNSLGAGDYFGELALLDDSARSASVRTMEPCQFRVVKKEDFSRVLAENPGITQQLMGNLASGEKAHNRCEEFGATRCLRARCERHMDMSEERGDGTLFVPEKLTQQDIADRVGASREMVARILKDLTIGEYIRFEGRHIVINTRLPAKY